MVGHNKPIYSQFDGARSKRFPSRFMFVAVSTDAPFARTAFAGRSKPYPRYF
jgi:hypothetical protein